MRKANYINGKLVYQEVDDSAIDLEEISKEEKLFQISEFKRLLSETDYISCKIADGVATREEYAEQLEQREAWRNEINRLQSELD